LKKILLLLFVTVLSCCSREEGIGRTLVAVLETSPNKLDPAFVVDVSEGTVCSMIFQGLVRFSPGASLVPDAAESWSIENNGKKYVFHLDSRMRFSNGRRLTASDVDYSFKRLLSKETLSPRRWVLTKK